MAYDKLLFYDFLLYKAHTQAQENWSVHSELNAVICKHTRKCPYKVSSYKLTRQDVLEQTPSWEANKSSANQEIPYILRNPKVYYRIQKRPPPVRILGHSNLVHDPILFLKSLLLLLLLSSHLLLSFPSGLLPSGQPTKSLYTLWMSPRCATWPARNLITRITFGKE